MLQTILIGVFDFLAHGMQVDYYDLMGNFDSSALYIIDTYLFHYYSYTLHIKHTIMIVFIMRQLI